MAGVISLITDFGLRDEYAGVMKGVILSISAKSTIVDITHGIGPQNIREAALVLESSYPYFPRTTVHVVVVDPGVGSERRIIAAAAAGQLFLAPDNGVLTPILGSARLERAHLVSNRSLFRHPVSCTFHGRDIFAPVAARLAGGLALAEIGEAVRQEDLVQLPMPQPIEDEKEQVLSGEIIAVDHFGNLLTNIDAPLLAAKTSAWSTACRVELRGATIEGVRLSYQSVGPGELLALLGSRNRLEIAVNGGSAAHHLQASVGEGVRVLFRRAAG